MQLRPSKYVLTQAWLYIRALCDGYQLYEHVKSLLVQRRIKSLRQLSLFRLRPPFLPKPRAAHILHLVLILIKPTVTDSLVDLVADHNPELTALFSVDMLTQALVVEKPGDPFVLQEVQLDEELREDEVQVKLAATGICHTDINFSKEGSMPDMFPGVFGHEGAGIVERVGSAVTAVAVGDHVICCYSCCGKCRFCLRKETAYCELWFQYNFGVGRLDGSKAFASPTTGQKITSHFFGQSSFSHFTILKETGCVKVPKSLPFNILAPLGCGIMTGSGAMLNVVQPEHDMSVVVVGVGAVGLAAVMACLMLPQPPRRLVAVDIVPARLELARRYGATHGVNSKVRTDLVKVLMDITDGQGVDGAIDTTGRPEVVQALMKSSARKGKVVTVGVGSLSAEASFNIFEMVNAGGSYVGCNEGDVYPQEFLPRLLEANKKGTFPYDDLLQTYRASDVASAIEDIKSGKTVKAVLEWE